MGPPRHDWIGDVSVRHFRRCLESELDRYEWKNAHLEYIPSLPEAVALIELDKPMDPITAGERDKKDRWDLLPWAELRMVARVLTSGISKHKSDFGWQSRPKSEHVQSALRHITSYLTGERLDPETGLPHLAHTVARLLFVAWHDNKE